MCYVRSKQTPRSMRTVALIGRAHIWTMAPNRSPVVGEREVAIVKGCTKGTPAEEIASDIRMKANHVPELQWRQLCSAVDL